MKVVLKAVHITVLLLICAVALLIAYERGYDAAQREESDGVHGHSDSWGRATFRNIYDAKP